MKLNLSISQKILIGYFSIIGLFLVSSLMTYFILQKNQEINRQVTEINDPSVRSIGELASLISESKLLIKSWVFIDKLPDTREKKRLQTIHQTDYPALLSKLKTYSKYWEDSEKLLLDSIDNTIKTLFSEHESIMHDLNSFESYNDFGLLATIEMKVDASGETMVLTDKALNLLTEMINKQAKNTDQAYAQVNESVSFFRIFIIVGALFIMIVGIFVAFFISNRIKISIASASKALSELSKGNLDFEIEIVGNDEVSALLTDLKGTISNLKEIVNAIVSATNDISLASEKLNVTSAKISEDASSQASSVEEISSSMEQMAANIQQNSYNAGNTNKISELVATEINRMQQASLESMESIQNIAQKIDIVNDIAFQTNILALNAAVEAARAGNQGGS